MFVTIICSVMLMAGLFPDAARRRRLCAGQTVFYIRTERRAGSVARQRGTVSGAAYNWVVFDRRFCSDDGGQHGIRRLGRNQKRLWFHSVFHQVFAMLLLLKAFDVCFLDWVLLCNAGFNFFPRFYLKQKKSSDGIYSALTNGSTYSGAAVSPVIGVDCVDMYPVLRKTIEQGST